MPADELGGPTALDLLRNGRVEVLGRIPWGSNATLLADVYAGDSDSDSDSDNDHDKPALRAVYKPRRGERPLWDFPPGLDRREVAAYELSEALGWGLVPETVLREDLPFGVGSLQRFVPFAADEHYFTLYESVGHHEALRTICCFDMLCNQTDRKSGHCLLADDGRIWAVDNGLAFHVDDKLRTVIWEFGGEKIPDQLRDDARRLCTGGIPEAVREMLDPDECAALARRAERVATRGVYPIAGNDRCYPWPLV